MVDRFPPVRRFRGLAPFVWWRRLLIGAMLAGAFAPTPSRAAGPLDDAKIAAAGIRKLAGQRLTLYTDLPSSEGVDALPALFDRAFPQWCAYFGLDAARLADWRVQGCLMKDDRKFAAVGLLPADLPKFLHGYTRGDWFWMHEQPSDYYRRHLLLHEGTHAFMFAALGSCGPPWYMEGMADFLATHQLADGKLTLPVFPARREDVPMWGRIKAVRDAVALGRFPSIADVMALRSDAFLKTEAYAWAWALAAFLDGHPRYRERFRESIQDVARDDFTARFNDRFAADRRQLELEWQQFFTTLDYGYDLARAAVEFAPGEPLPERGRSMEIAADRGWQSTGVHLEAGKTYRLTASGRYQVANQPTIWWCEPGGVSIRYIRGRPLGMLLAAIVPDPRDEAPRKEDAPPDSASRPATKPKLSPARGGLLEPIDVGLGAKVVPRQSGTLYLRINESEAALGDNSGSVNVQIQAIGKD